MKKTQPGGTRMNTDWTDFHGFEIRVLRHIAVLFYTFGANAARNFGVKISIAERA